jgi:histidinol phosphatase-like enzyme
LACLAALDAGFAAGATVCARLAVATHGVRRGCAVDCVCGLPRLGLLTRAGDKYGIDRERSWMIGDTLDQAEGGVRAGCRTCPRRRRAVPPCAAARAPLQRREGTRAVVPAAAPEH